MPAKQIPLNKILSALDRKDRGFYDRLDEDEKKGFSPFLMLRWASCVGDDPELEHYYIASTNHHANPHMLVHPLTKHPKLQWLLFTAVSPGLGTMRHNWVKPPKKPKLDGVRGALATMHPNMKDCDLDLLSQYITMKEIKTYVKDSGEQSKK